MSETEHETPETDGSEQETLAEPETPEAETPAED